MSGVVSKTLGWLGFGPEEGASYPTGAASSAATARAAAPRPVTPIRSRSRGYSDISEISTLQPRSYSDAAEVAARYREGIPVIVNMADLSELDSRRLLDFMLGLKEGLEGHLKRVTPKVFLLSPAHVAVNDEDEDLPADSSDDLLIRP